MGNAAKRKRSKHGISRPGPAARVAEARLHEEVLSAVTENARERKARQRARDRERLELSQSLAIVPPDPNRELDDYLPVRDLHRRSLRLAQYIVEELRSCPGPFSRKDVMEKVLRHDIVSPLLPVYYPRPQEAKVIHSFIENFKHELQLVKVANSNELLARKSALLDAAVSLGTDGVRSLSRVLDTTTESINLALTRRVYAFDTQDTVPKLRLQRLKRAGLSDYIKQCVDAWWNGQTKVSPNQKDVIRHRVGRVQWLEPHPTHYLCETQTCFFLRFKEAHPECTVRQRAFERLKPWWIRKLKERNTCCCIYHVEMDFMKVALSNLRDRLRGLHASINCACECVLCLGNREGGCHAHEHVFKRITLMWEACVCPKGEFDLWHRLECLMGDCPNCGFHLLTFCELELCSSSSFTLKWKCFEYYQVGVDANTGKPKKRLKEVFKETTAHVFLSYMEKTVTTFITHNFRARWQDEQCQLMMANVPEGVVVSHIDYAENYSFAIQNEVQSLYYFSTSITILVHITMWREGDEIFKQTHFYISDDKDHDSAFVQHSLLLHWDWLVDSGFSPEEHWVFSDGCSAQFKCATAMYFVARYPILTGGCMMRWNFFESAHGKGEWDGAGAVVKRALAAEQIQNPLRPLQNASQVVQFLEEKYTERIVSSYTQSKTSSLSRVFWHIGEKEVDHNNNSLKCNTIPGSKSLYSIMGFSMTESTLLKTRALSCFCIPCVDGDWDNCERSSHVQPWQVQRLVPISITTPLEQVEEVDEVENWLHDGVSIQIGDMVEVGDNFMIPAEEDNEDGVQFYILQCQRTKFVLQESFTCPWGGIFNAGDAVIRGKYYKKFGRGDKTYVFCDKAVDAHVDAHLVRACKFPMILASHRVKGTPVYKMSAESQRMCEDALREWWAFNAE